MTPTEDFTRSDRDPRVEDEELVVFLDDDEFEALTADGPVDPSGEDATREPVESPQRAGSPRPERPPQQAESPRPRVAGGERTAARSPAASSRAGATRTRSRPALRRTGSDGLHSEIEAEVSRGAPPADALFSKPWIYGSVAFFLVAVLGTLLYIGWDYYSSPLSRRPLHYLHSLLRPSGRLGLMFGIGGTLVIVASLVYIAKKRFARRFRWGTLQGWLGFHVFTGIVGPCLVLFHAAFVPRSALGLFAMLALGVVVASGFVGRYILAFFPRGAEGRELDLEALRQRLHSYRVELAQFGVPESLLLVEMPQRRDWKRDWFWLYYAVVGVIYGDRTSRRDFEQLRQLLQRAELSRHSRERVAVVARRFCRERQWMVRYRELHRLMSAWRFFHQWMAVLLLAAITYHVVIALVFGHVWETLVGKR